MQSVSHGSEAAICGRPADPTQNVALAIEEQEHHLLLRWNGEPVVESMFIHVKR
ncbi:MAG: hypothetical protein QOK38_1695 [Acidobacteriaceae bacterium]|nr:hypothetical protein [Acidobacteriaceae bacterium]